MKRRSYQGAKRRDRRVGVSPYKRHSKAPYRYSTAYYEWRRAFRPDQRREEQRQ